MSFTEFGKWGEWVQHLFLKGVTAATKNRVDVPHLKIPNHFGNIKNINFIVPNIVCSIVPSSKID